MSTPIGPDPDQATAVAVQGDGKVVVAGTMRIGTRSYFLVVRYRADGSLDTSFNGTGKVTTAVRDVNDYATGVAVQGDGKIVVVGWSASSQSDDFAVVRYHPDGSLDEGFNGTGVAVSDFGLYADRAMAVAIQPNGKIVVAGVAFTVTGGVYDKFAMVRYNADGTEDRRALVAVGGALSGANAVAIQPDGKIVLAGYAAGDFALVRLAADGTLDTSLNGTGRVVTPNASATEGANAVLVQPDGKIVVVGQMDPVTGPPVVAALRYATDGTLDVTFNGTGTSTFVVQDRAGAHAAALQPDGKIVAAGYSFGVDGDVLLVRWNPDGSLDTTFGDGGHVRTDVGGYFDVAYAIAIQSDGRIVVAGYSDASGNNDVALARYWP